MSIILSGITAGYGKDPDVLSNIDLEIETGGITVLIGPNGCGKSTLLKTIGRLLKPRAGTASVDGLDVLTSPSKQIAQTIAYLPQSPAVPVAVSVEQLVGYGRAPHQSLLGLKSAEDIERIDHAIDIAGIGHLRHRQVAELSGGQRQSVFFAMVLAQDTPYAMLDEPTNHLDLTHQIEVLELIARLKTEHGKTAIVVLHDLNLAARYADRLIVFEKGAIYADGRPEEVLTETTLSEVFAVDSRIITDPVHGRPFCIPYPHGPAARTANGSESQAERTARAVLADAAPRR